MEVDYLLTKMWCIEIKLRINEGSFEKALRILQGAWTFAFQNCVQRWKQTPVYSCKNNYIIIVLDRKMEINFF